MKSARRRPARLPPVLTATGEIDSADTIVRRVEQALEHLSPERITLNPDCAFAPDSAAVVRPG